MRSNSIYHSVCLFFLVFLVAQQLNMSSCFFCVCVCLFDCVSHPTYGYGYMNLSHTRPILTKCDHTKSIQANLNQTKLKQTKKDHTNVTKIQASPLLSVCPILSTYKLTFPNRTHKLDQTKITLMDLVWLKVLRNSCTVPYLFACL